MFEFTIWQRCLGLKKPKGKCFKDVVEQVASSLNWYLEPRSRLFPGWKSITFFFLLLIIILVFGIMRPLEILLGTYFLANLVFISWQRVNNLEFAIYLRDRIAA